VHTSLPPPDVESLKIKDQKDILLNIILPGKYNTPLQLAPEKGEFPFTENFTNIIHCGKISLSRNWR
jgi:hypothetical protein